ncbi:MAG TPA: hypothetical protein VF103_15440, partial [Polyangiaceae bacterium]
TCARLNACENDTELSEGALVCGSAGGTSGAGGTGGGAARGGMAGASGTGTGAGGASAGAGTEPGDSGSGTEPDGGCGCRFVREDSEPPFATLTAVLFALAALRARSTSRRRSTVQGRARGVSSGD